MQEVERFHSEDTELPAYSQIRNTSTSSRTQHSYHLSKSGKKWLTVSVQSRATDPQEIPNFAQGHTISGSVGLDLANEAVIRAVSVSVVGDLLSSDDIMRFLTINQVLAVSDMNELDQDGVRTGHPQPATYNGKLQGKYSWPFEIRLPKGVSIVLDNCRSNYQLPPSFQHSSSRARVEYHIVVRVKKGVLSSNHRLLIPFIFTQRARPSQPSILRQISYLEQTPLVGPEGDPDGWKTLDSVQIQGTFFRTRPIEATCTLSLARPLCYTQGAVIPLILSISSEDSHALDLLSTPSAPCVQLLRPWDSQDEVIGSATWWCAPAAQSAYDTKVLHGEIRIPPDAIPNCRILHFELEYWLSMMHFRAISFTPDDPPPKACLISEKIQIVTVHAEGPQHIAYSPPSYAST
ncbi:hypothetical protein ABKN59_006343 [Abortiporus biennis]